MTKAAELAKMGEVLTNSQIGGRRNIVINGAMQVAQRATSATRVGASAGYFTCDRWKAELGNSAGRFTMSQTSDGPTGFANCLKLDCTTADTSIASNEFLYIAQSLEGQDVQLLNKGVTGAKQVTLSFYVKASSALNLVAEIQDYDNGRIIAKSYATTTDWVRHEMIFDADTDDGSSPLDDDNGASLAVNFWLHGGSNFTSGTLNTSWQNRTDANRFVGGDSFFSSTDNNFFLTGVQLEVGSQATPFEHRSFGEELALCQRYYAVVAHGASSQDGTSHPVSMGAMYNSSTLYSNLELPCDMRTTPTLEIVSATGYYTFYRNGGSDVVDDFALTKWGTRVLEFYNNSDISGTAGHAGFIRTSNSAAKFAVTAELQDLSMINTVKKNKDPITNEFCSYQVTQVGTNVVLSVPLDPANTDYQAIQEWVAEGNTIQEAD